MTHQLSHQLAVCEYDLPPMLYCKERQILNLVLNYYSFMDQNHDNSSYMYNSGSMNIGIMCMLNRVAPHNVPTLQLQDLQLDPQLGLLSVWSLCACSPHVPVGLFWALWFCPPCQKHANSWNG